MNHLLTRGEDPENIRVLDTSRAPTWTDLTQGLAKLAEFIRTDVVDEGSVIAGFTKSWPLTASQDSDITLICTVANIQSSPPRSTLPDSRTLSRDHSPVAFRFLSPLPLALSESGAQDSSLLRGSPSQSFLPRSYGTTARNRGGTTTFLSNYGYTKMIGEVRVLAADKSSGASGKTLRAAVTRGPRCGLGPTREVLS